MDRPLNAQETSAYREAVKRRALKEPIAYIVGLKEFYGLEIDVSPAVLIPRPDTEHLVELALAQIPQDQPTLAIDVCTGSGCVAIALAKHRPHLTVWATEIDPQAHAVALENVKNFIWMTASNVSR